MSKVMHNIWLTGNYLLGQSFGFALFGIFPLPITRFLLLLLFWLRPSFGYIVGLNSKVRQLEYIQNNQNSLALYTVSDIYHLHNNNCNINKNNIIWRSVRPKVTRSSQSTFWLFAKSEGRAQIHSPKGMSTRILSFFFCAPFLSFSISIL